MAQGKNIHHLSAHEKAIEKLLRELACSHGLWQVFRDFVAMSALSISNAVDRRDYVARESEYMQIVKRYTKAEAEIIAHCLSYVVMAFEDEGPQDFLGALFMKLDLGNSWAGQFFTPYTVCQMMAKMNLSDGMPQKIIAERGFITVSDPCTGGGAMLIAGAQALQDAGINYQQHMHVTAQDIDITAVYMTYIQLSLLHVPAVVIHGNSLALETRSIWRTPAHVLGFWGNKLRRAEKAEQVKEIEAELIQLATKPVLTPLFSCEDEANELFQTTSYRVSQYSLF